MSDIVVIVEDDEISVIEREEQIHVVLRESELHVVSVGEAGPAGPPGTGDDTGDDGQVWTSQGGVGGWEDAAPGFTEQQVRDTPLTGIDLTSQPDITETSTLLVALGSVYARCVALGANFVTLFFAVLALDGSKADKTTTINGHALSADVTLTKNDVGLGNVDNTSDASKPVSTAQAAADATVLATAEAYADGLVVGLLDDRGNFDASGNIFPASGGSGPAGAIKKGDLWSISVDGTLGGHVVTVGDVVRAKADTPGQTDANWAITENNFGYVAENSANKNASGGYAGLTLFKLNLRNAANTITSWFTTAATVARTWTMPDKDGTVAMTSDITGTNSGTNTGDQDLSSYATTAAVAAGYQPLDSDLTAIAALSTTSFGRALLALADAAALRTAAALGSIATQDANNVSISGGAITGTTIDGVSIKNYVDGLVAGLKWKTSVVAATTAALTLASDFENGDTLDGVTLATGDRILVKNQATGSENGIYIVAVSGAPTRSTDADSGAELVSCSVFVQSGTANADKAFVCTNDAITLGSTSITFTAFASVVGALIAANNLSDLASASTARTNLGLAAVAASGSASDLSTGTLPAGRLPAHTGDATSSAGSAALTVVALNGVNLAGLATGIVKNTTSTGAPSIAVAGDFPTLNQNTTGSAAKWTTARALYGNNVDGSADVTAIIASTYGGIGNGFTKISGPASTEKTFTLPNASDTIATYAVANVFTASQQIASGFSLNWNADTYLYRRAAATPQFGDADSATPVAQTVAFQGSRGGTDSNVAAVTATIQGSLGTGTGAVGDLVLKTGTVAASGTTAHAAAARLTINSAGATATVPWIASATTGDAAPKAFTFTGDTDTGISYSSANTFNLCANGAKVMQVFAPGVDFYNGAAVQWRFSSTGLNGIASSKLFWAPTTVTVSIDLSLERDALGVAAFKDGGSSYRDLKLRNLLVQSGVVTLGIFTVATLPTGTRASTAYVTDSNTTFALGLGLTVVGGGANEVTVFYNNVNWIVG